MKESSENFLALIRERTKAKPPIRIEILRASTRSTARDQCPRRDRRRGRGRAFRKRQAAVWDSARYMTPLKEPSDVLVLDSFTYSLGKSQLGPLMLIS